MSPSKIPTTVIETSTTRILCYNTDCPRLLATFDYRREDRQGFPAQEYSQFFAKAGYAYLTVHSSTNNWFLSPDLPLIRKTLAAFTKPFERITSMGFSMGGYGALLYCRAMRTNQIMLSSPSSNITETYFPDEIQHHISQGTLEPRFDTLTENPRAGLHGVLLYDTFKPLDVKHAANIIRAFPKIRPVPMPFGGHPATRAITQANMFGTIQQELLRDRIRPQAFLNLHKQARHTAGNYQHNLKVYLQKRRDRGLD